MQFVDVFLLEDVVMRLLISEKDKTSHCGQTLGHRLKGYECQYAEGPNNCLTACLAL